MLTEVDFGSDHHDSLTYASFQLSSYFPHLKVFTLRVYLFYVICIYNVCFHSFVSIYSTSVFFQEEERLHEVPELIMLERPVLTVDQEDHTSLLKFTLLITAAPHLHEFVLQVRSLLKLGQEFNTRISLLVQLFHGNLEFNQSFTS